MTTDEARVCESDTTTTFANRLLTVDTAGLVAVVRTVVNFVTLFGAVDAGSVTTLELIRPTCEQGCRTHGIIFTITAAKFSGGTDLFKDKETLLILFPKVLLERCKRDNVLHPDPAAISQTKFSFTEEKKLMEIKIMSGIYRPSEEILHPVISGGNAEVRLGVCSCCLEQRSAGLFNSFVFLTGCLIIHALCFGPALLRGRRRT